MYFPRTFQLLTLILLKYTPFAIALPAVATSNSSAITINSSTPLSSTSWTREVALGIAVVNRAYPSIIPRLSQILAFGPTGRSQSVPFFPERTVLYFQLQYPKVAAVSKPAPEQPWEITRETDSPPDFQRRPFNWDRLPMSFEEAQQKLLEARNIPNDQKITTITSIYVLLEDHPSGLALRGDLVYRFSRLVGPGILHSSVLVDANNGQVVSEGVPVMAADAVQVT